jgi:peroxiredoxin Q/BCP
MTKGLDVGDKAPDFTLQDQNGREFRLWDMVGKKAIVIYFYPKDFTPGCTEEAYAFRDKYEVFRDAGAEVIGISSDSVESHRKFAKELKLPYILLSDVGGKIRQLYGDTSLGGIPGRVTFVIDKNGTIRLVFFSQLQPTKHIQEAVRVIEEIGRDK